MCRYTLAVFDLDGTLLDTLDDLQSSVNFALKSEGFPPKSREEIKGFVGNGIRKLIERSLPEDTDTEIAERVFSSFKAHYALHNADRTSPYEGILPLLTELKAKGIRLALISNKADLAVNALAKNYFDGLFDIVLGDRDGVPRKPDPTSVNEVLEKFSVKRQSAVYIGDSDVDVLTAKNAGIDCISVTWGFRDRDLLLENGAQVLADTAEELKNLIIN